MKVMVCMVPQLPGKCELTVNTWRCFLCVSRKSHTTMEILPSWSRHIRASDSYPESVELKEGQFCCYMWHFSDIKFICFIALTRFCCFERAFPADMFSIPVEVWTSRHNLSPNLSNEYQTITTTGQKLFAGIHRQAWSWALIPIGAPAWTGSSGFSGRNYL